ncbi:protein zyg-11 homolog isoform X1 [Salvelinus namaycush]|uniref:Protein zyg-11 homolog isoform X1 n=1 Tax=Salvelinus namaycush TaxID=8040 RepID=A0A8U1BSC8_SALNM|nr:protein zyg-11 homolog isoform X1 [Salvelinus namaycush]XP_038858532.1 protein zyg-11 homolog isoform X1 [Salvelinus namaycush]
MDEASPASLTDLCLSYVSGNLERFCAKHADGSLCLRDSLLFPQELADQLLAKMATEGLLNDSTVGVFRSCEYLRLRRACIRTARISAEAFQRALCPHRLLELDAARVNADLTISDILQGLASNKHCQESLQRLVLTGLTMSSLEEPSRHRFSSLQGLRSLSLANVDFYDAGLADVCSLPRLESLDLSNTSVTNLSPLLGLRERLRSLTLHQLKRLEMSTAQLLAVIGQLEALQHLDISDDKQFTSDVARQLLGEPGILPALVSLDVSGRKQCVLCQVTDAAVKVFVEERPGMTFVGLLATDAGFSDFLNGEGSLKVTGEANETQICESLHRYSERDGFVREALFHLFSLTHVMEKPRPDILKLVILGMKNHPATLNVQLAASACVFNLTKQDLAAGMPVRLLGTVTQLLLEAMRTFPNHQQLQKNCLLSLCSDRILQEVPFNRFEAAKLVMQWLCNHEDQNMQRMAVAIISILAAKLSTEQTAQLGAELFIVKQLLHIVRQKATQGGVDATLKFTLSALWNLTDESPTTCRHFIENQGLELFIKVLESFPSESSIQQKVLGLLNNIAEVGELHEELMVQGFLDHIRSLLHSPEVEVSYFAAGILAHLTSRGEAAWTLSITLRSDLLEQLHSAILKWQTPECEMVAYRSFNPFFPLLECFHTPGVQLWAAWAMQHVCSKNAPRYCSMLLEEGGLQQLEKVQTHPDTHADVMRLTDGILESLQRHQARTGQTTQTPPHKESDTP